MNTVINQKALQKIQAALKAPAKKSKWIGVGPDPDPHYHSQIKTGLQCAEAIILEHPNTDLAAHFKGVMLGKVRAANRYTSHAEKSRILNEIKGLAQGVSLYADAKLWWLALQTKDAIESTHQTKLRYVTNH